MKKIFFLSVIIFSITANEACRKSNYYIEEEVTIIDQGSGIGTITLKAKTDYILEGLVFVNDGQILTIEAGTVIRAKTGQADKASALIVARGGKIIAEGTKDAPIIFTVAGDDLAGSIPIEGQGLWGGIIILGNAPIDSPTGEAQVEGINLSEPRAIYGGNDPHDNSGIFRYISIRHGGTNIGQNNEINGLTLAGVGDNTEIDHIEVISNKDDGFEFFGGTVNCKYLVAAFCGDEAFDFDLGYSGNIQFALGLEKIGTGNHLIEIDSQNGSLKTNPNMLNITLIGNNINTNEKIISFNGNSAGYFANSIFLNQKNGISIEYLENEDCAWKNWQSQKLQIINNIFFDIAENNPQKILKIHGDQISGENFDLWIAYFSEANNIITDPSINFEAGDFFPANNANHNPTSPPDTWFEEVNFIGAFGEENWLTGWTLIAE